MSSRDDMPSDYRHDFLACAFQLETEKESSSGFTPEKVAAIVISSLQYIYSSIESFSKLRRKMDKTHFAELMIADNFHVSAGVDKKERLKISFMRYGTIFEGKNLHATIHAINKLYFPAVKLTDLA